LQDIDQNPQGEPAIRQIVELKKPAEETDAVEKYRERDIDPDDRCHELAGKKAEIGRREEMNRQQHGKHE
jgi:hypothetical protein